MFELQGRDRYGTWSAENVSWNPEATQFATEHEAREELEYWVGEGRDRTDLRIIAVE